MTHDRRPLSKKEEEIMNYFWKEGPLFIREIVERMAEPKPHVNTVATFVRSIEAKGWLTREQIGNSYRYSPAVPMEEVREKSMRGLIDRFFNKSYLSFVSALVKEDKISPEDLREMLEKIEQGKEE
ncbi:MAG: BlaI/MecI/CopY family transcriptional regulator [Muribaculaceae bacterium]|nr:BlaI/MecI/CopY family transcriptional regulator [Muribaculaceae bacterium]